MGRVGANAAINAFVLASNVGLNLLLIPRYGIAGAAVASSVAYSAQAFAMTAWVARHTGNTLVSMFTSASPRLILDLVRRLLPAGSGLQGRLRA
jgi:O-antigen/teichoic acid export membrane protein